jgi:hypothetical protein
MSEDFKPHENYYLISTHHEFLMSQTASAIDASRTICRELMAELRAEQVKPARAIEQQQDAKRLQRKRQFSDQ